MSSNKYRIVAVKVFNLQFFNAIAFLTGGFASTLSGLVLVLQ
jgi:uncharacterized membrane protein